MSKTMIDRRLRYLYLINILRAHYVGVRYGYLYSPYVSHLLLTLNLFELETKEL